MEKARAVLCGGRTLRLTCSVGLATYPAHGRTRESLLDAADKGVVIDILVRMQPDHERDVPAGIEGEIAGG